MRFLLSGLFLLAALLPAIAQTPVKKKSFLEKPTLEAYVRHLFVWPKEIAVTVSDPKPSSVEGMFDVAVTGSMNGASQTVPFLVSKNGQKIVQGLTYDVNSNPYKANIDQMKTTFAPAIGKPNAPVKIVIFSDFQCPHCQEEARMIRANLIQTFSKEVHAYFKEFPLVQIHDWAKPAAIAGRCVYRE